MPQSQMHQHLTLLGVWDFAVLHATCSDSFLCMYVPICGCTSSVASKDGRFEVHCFLMMISTQSLWRWSAHIFQRIL
jgi:hypothetical protein